MVEAIFCLWVFFSVKWRSEKFSGVVEWAGWGLLEQVGIFFILVFGLYLCAGGADCWNGMLLFWVPCNSIELKLILYFLLTRSFKLYIKRVYFYWQLTKVNYSETSLVWRLLSKLCSAVKFCFAFTNTTKLKTKQTVAFFMLIMCFRFVFEDNVTDKQNKTSFKIHQLTI